MTHSTSTLSRFLRFFPGVGTVAFFALSLLAAPSAGQASSSPWAGTETPSVAAVPGLYGSLSHELDPHRAVPATTGRTHGRLWSAVAARRPEPPRQSSDGHPAPDAESSPRRSLESWLRGDSEAGSASSHLLSTRSLFASAVTLRTGNDLMAGNSLDDDIYTAGLGFVVEFDRAELGVAQIGRSFLSFEENLFTDRQAGARFDESWLLVGRRRRSGDRDVALYAGGVRAGRGVFGEDLQNAVHRLIGDEEVELFYVADNELFPVVGAHVKKLVTATPRFALTSDTELRLAPGFQHWLRFRLDADMRLTPWLRVFGGVGGRASWAEYDLLEPWVESVAPVAEAGVLLKERLGLSWATNTYGTGRSHWSLTFRVPMRHGGAR